MEPIIMCNKRHSDIFIAIFPKRNTRSNRYPCFFKQFLGKNVNELRWGQRIRSPEAMNLIKNAEVCDKVDEILR